MAEKTWKKICCNQRKSTFVQELLACLNMNGIGPGEVISLGRDAPISDHCTLLVFTDKKVPGYLPQL